MLDRLPGEQTEMRPSSVCSKSNNIDQYTRIIAMGMKLLMVFHQPYCVLGEKPLGFFRVDPRNAMARDAEIMQVSQKPKTFFVVLLKSMSTNSFFWQAIILSLIIDHRGAVSIWEHLD